MGALVAAGIIKPGMALADWNKAAFETKNRPIRSLAWRFPASVLQPPPMFSLAIAIGPTLAGPAGWFRCLIARFADDR